MTLLLLRFTVVDNFVANQANLGCSGCRGQIGALLRPWTCGTAWADDAGRFLDGICYPVNIQYPAGAADSALCRHSGQRLPAALPAALGNISNQIDGIKAL